MFDKFIKEYVNDISKYAEKKDKLLTLDCLDSILAIFTSKNKRFIFGK